MTYYQENSWIEEGWGPVTARFLISDIFEGLYLNKTEITQANIFDFDEVHQGIGNKSGGVVSSNITINIDQAKINTAAETAALMFVLDAQVATNKRFCALFVDTPATPQPNDCMFFGLIQTDMESDDEKWHGQHWEGSITPIKKYKIKASPYQTSAFDKVELSTIIDKITRSWDGTNWGELDTDLTWQTAYVTDRQGYYHNAGPFMTKIDNIISLNKALRKLADILTIELKRANLGEINITFSQCTLDGNFHPARWRKTYNPGGQMQIPADNQYIGDWIGNKAAFFSTYIDDFKNLVIDPDAVTENEYTTPWINYRLIKIIDDDYDNPNDNDCNFLQKKNFFEFIESLAANFGCYVKYYWTDTITLNIEFIPRSAFIQNEIFLKTATKAQDKISPIDLSTIKPFTGKACGSALTGLDVYTRNFGIIPNVCTPSTKLQNRNVTDGTQLLLSISPTVADLSPIYDFNINWLFGLHFAHNHKQMEGTKVWKEAIGLHTAIYLKVDNYIPHPDSIYHAATYWTPAAQFSIAIAGTTEYFEKYEDYLNRLNELDLNYYDSEKTIETPFFYGFSPNMDGSGIDWRTLKVGSLLTLDNIGYTVIDIKWKFGTPNVTITLHATPRYDQSSTVSGDPLPGISSIANPYTIDPYTYEILTAAETSGAGQAVSITPAGTIEVAYPSEDHYERIYGIAINDLIEGSPVYVQKTGIITIPDGMNKLEIGKQVFLRDLGSVPFPKNYSQEPLDGVNDSETLYCPIGIATGEREFEIKPGFPQQFIFESSPVLIE